MKDLTIAYFTARKDPKIEWFFRSLAKQLKEPLGQLVIVDYYAEEAGRTAKFKELADLNGLKVETCNHITPKPCVWQGKHRLTRNEYFAASNARNTAFALCRSNFIACVDDLSVLLPTWLDNVAHAKQHNYIILGAYKKVKRLEVDENCKIDYDEFRPGTDSRLYMGDVKGNVPITGQQFFGCSFGLPIEAALKVNGFDELCDGQGAEDYDFGIRLERAGEKLWYNINMMTYESEELHHIEGNAKFVRESKEMMFDGKKMGSDWVMLTRVLRENRSTTISDHYNLRELRMKMLAGGEFPVMLNPQHDWRDGQELSKI